MGSELAAELEPLLHLLIGVNLRHVIQARVREQSLERVLGSLCSSDGEGGRVTVDRFLQRA
jgi:hypothetical protein